MKNKNITIGILAVLLVSSLIWNYTCNKTTIVDKVLGENAKIALRELNETIEKEAKTNYALAKARVALLKSEIALTIDKSEKVAKEELDNAIKYLSEAKLTADEKTKVEIEKLKAKVNITKMKIVQKRMMP